MSFITYQNLKEYQSLNFEDRLKGYLSEKAVVEVEKNYNEDPLVDIREYCAGIALDKSFVDFRIRKAFAEKLKKVQNSLTKNYGLSLKVYETYRKLSKQKKEFEEIKQEIKSKNPGITEEVLWDKTTEFIADPSLCPPHTTGGAIDLTLVDISGNELDMGTPVNAIDSAAAVFSLDVPEEARKNRRILYTTMLEMEIAPLCTEWWHYSYGEAYWAALYKKPQIYSPIDL